MRPTWERAKIGFQGRNHVWTRLRGVPSAVRQELAADCREDGQWSFLYAAAPVHVVGATGAPVNPVVVK